MTCEELRERLVDPGSAGQGGHAPVVEHLNTCVKCKAIAKSFGAIERLLRPETAGDPPKDFDYRVLGRLVDIQGVPTRSGVSPIPLAIALVVAVGAGLLVFLPRKKPVSQPAPAATPRSKLAAGTSSEEAPPPAILAVNSSPISIDGPPLSPEERERVTRLFDTDFLRNLDMLVAIDAFFPEDVVLPDYAGPFQPKPTAVVVRPPETPESLEHRLEDWRRLPKENRVRLEKIDAEFRAHPADERDLILRRWTAVQALPPDDLSGLRRLASRFADLDARKLGKVKEETRAITALPIGQRSAKFRATDFAKSLTGQELASAEHLLQSR